MDRCRVKPGQLGGRLLERLSSSRAIERRLLRMGFCFRSSVLSAGLLAISIWAKLTHYPRMLRACNKTDRGNDVQKGVYAVVVWRCCLRKLTNTASSLLGLFSLIVACLDAPVSIGKCSLKIAIAEQETNLPPGYIRAAVIRSGPQTVLSMVFPIAALAYIVIDGLFIFSKSRQCLHDRLARTVVIVGTREWWTRSPTGAFSV